MASPSDGTARPSTTWTASAASSSSSSSSPNRRSSLVSARGTATPTRWRPVIAHDGRGTPHRGTLLLDQDSTGGNFLTINLTTIHVLDGILGPVRIDKIYIAKTARERLEPVNGEVYGANFTVRAEDLQDVILDNVTSEPPDVYSGWPWRYGPLLPATF